jgi:hypothetical protein
MFANFFSNVLSYPDFVAGQRKERISIEDLFVLNELVECSWKEEQPKCLMMNIVTPYDLRIGRNNFIGDTT